MASAEKCAAVDGGDKTGAKTESSVKLNKALSCPGAGAKPIFETSSQPRPKRGATISPSSSRTSGNISGIQIYGSRYCNSFATGDSARALRRLETFPEESLSPNESRSPQAVPAQQTSGQGCKLQAYGGVVSPRRRAATAREASTREPERAVCEPTQPLPAQRAPVLSERQSALSVDVDADVALPQNVGLGRWVSGFRNGEFEAAGSRTTADTVSWPTHPDAYTMICPLGKGSFATVWKATCQVQISGSPVMREVAIKFVDLEKFDHIWDYIENEIVTMLQLRHRNIVRVLASFVVETYIWIVLPFFRCGSALHLLKTVSPVGFRDPVLVATILYQTVQGLIYFHANHHVHRDIKADNILISSTGRVSLGDFGVSATIPYMSAEPELEPPGKKRSESMTHKRPTSIVGTPCFMAPEILSQGVAYGYKVDIWSLGITTMELIYGRAPYTDMSRAAVLDKIVAEPAPSLDYYRKLHIGFQATGSNPADWLHLRSFVECCLAKNESNRATAAEILSHPFLLKYAVKGDQQAEAYLVKHVIKKLPESYFCDLSQRELGSSMEVRAMALDLAESDLDGQKVPPWMLCGNDTGPPFVDEEWNFD